MQTTRRGWLRGLIAIALPACLPAASDWVAPPDKRKPLPERKTAGVRSIYARELDQPEVLERLHWTDPDRVVDAWGQEQQYIAMDSGPWGRGYRMTEIRIKVLQELPKSGSGAAGQ